MGSSDRKGGGFGPPKGGPESLPPEVREALKLTGQQVADHLLNMYPLSPPEEIKKAAAAAASDIVNFGQVTALLTPEGREKVPYVGLRIFRESKLVGGKPEKVLEGCVPQDMDKCTKPEQVATLATIFALISSPIARGIMYLHGYRLGFFLQELRKDPIH